MSPCPSASAVRIAGRTRQVELRVQPTVEEAGDGPDRPAAQREDDDARRVRRPRLVEVAAEGGLQVGPRRQKLEPAGSAPLGAGPEEGRYGALADVLVRGRRHGQPGVVGEQRDHAVAVAFGEGGGEATGALAL